MQTNLFFSTLISSLVSFNVSTAHRLSVKRLPHARAEQANKAPEPQPGLRQWLPYANNNAGFRCVQLWLCDGLVVMANQKVSSNFGAQQDVGVTFNALCNLYRYGGVRRYVSPHHPAQFCRYDFGLRSPLRDLFCLCMSKFD